MLEENKILEDIIKKRTGEKMCFQQDGAPAHNAKKSKYYIKSKINLIDEWPPNSPDLFVIENLWAILKKRIIKRKPNTIEEIKEILVEEWDNLDQ